MASSTMKAWQYTAISGGQLEKSINLTTSVTPPALSSLCRGQVLIKVITAAINPVDYKIPELAFLRKLMITLPAIPGLDFCGRVVGTHPSSNDTLKEGQLVFGALNKAAKFGSLGQFIVISSDECAPLPEGIEPDHAAAAGIAALTAYQSYPRNIVKPGSKVFINGGSGGTGTFGIQFAKALGAEVTVTCSTGNIELCRSLGADEVLDYKKIDILSELKNKGQVFDLAVDNAASPASLYERSGAFLKKGGKFMQVGVHLSFSGMGSAFSRPLRPAFLGGGNRAFHFVRVSSNRKDLREIGKLMAEGRVKAVIDEVFEFEDVPRAYEKLRAGHAKGKIVVHVTEK
ncbi:MAG: hypothetical protein M1834_002348 [Cirrosporium novae-zelandiae]|nr:MAG: hypothetical protein M1834_002348 [Cirrosporium novae-zelandiae]